MRGSLTYTTQFGAYVSIGNLVQIFFLIQTQSINTAPTGRMQVDSLPYDVWNGDWYNSNANSITVTRATPFNSVFAINGSILTSNQIVFRSSPSLSAFVDITGMPAVCVLYGTGVYLRSLPDIKNTTKKDEIIIENLTINCVEILKTNSNNKWRSVVMNSDFGRLQLQDILKDKIDIQQIILKVWGDETTFENIVDTDV